MNYLDSLLTTDMKAIVVCLTLAGGYWLAQYSYPRTDMHGNKLSAISNFYASLKSSDQVLVDLYAEDGGKL